MIFVYSPLHARHDGGKELYRGEFVPTFETPARVDHILAALQAGHDSSRRRRANFRNPGCIGSTTPISSNSCARRLRAGMRRAAKAACCRAAFRRAACGATRKPAGISGSMGYYAFDASTPIMEGTWDAALAAAHSAMTAAAMVREGKSAVYALCRPPGHHASTSVYGGYCYLNNAALAAQYLIDEGCGRVALLDIDYHHGNGSQEIFWERDDVLFVSLHGTPDSEYPYFLGYADERGAGRGAGYTLNLPLPLGTGWDSVRGRARRRARSDRPLRAGCARRIARRRLHSNETRSAVSSSPPRHYPLIGSRLAGLGLPTVLVQEGGYAVAEIGANVAGVLGAFAARPA